MNINPIKTENDYRAALKRLEIVFDAEPNTAEGDELEVLSMLIENYENLHLPIEKPHPDEANKFRLEQLG